MPYKKCLCGTTPGFNMPGETKPICCKVCKSDEMVDVRNKKCSCGKHPSYNFPWLTTGVCCSKCKKSGMVDVITKKCSCGKKPNYNMPGENIGVCCKVCKTEEMIDVVTKRCKCGSQPSYNLAGETKGVCCKICKTDEMIDIKHNRCSCGKRPNFNVPWKTKGVCCSKCKTFEMTNVVHKICPGYNRPCPVRTYLGNGHEYCMSCDPNDARRKLYKRFEEEFFVYVKDKLDVHKREFVVSFDQNETSKKYARIDGIVFGDEVIVCLEVDENGHRDYECDEHRMHLVTAELLQEYPDHVVSWVRVNPTIGSKNEWSKTSVRKREKRFEEVVTTVSDILNTHDTRIVYIGFN